MDKNQLLAGAIKEKGLKMPFKGAGIKFGKEPHTTFKIKKTDIRGSDDKALSYGKATKASLDTVKARHTARARARDAVNAERKAKLDKKVRKI
tara:strand:+ start:1721 stop:1999 length:279 start_codon:yes stop_codon:yes gene_type:complete